jgi:hypothetical protein
LFNNARVDAIDFLGITKSPRIQNVNIAILSNALANEMPESSSMLWQTKCTDKPENVKE